MFYYWAYGLSIASAIEIPEMLPYQATAIDLHIRLGSVPEQLPEAPLRQVGSMQMSARYYRLELPICTYYVEEGKMITIAVKAGADDRSLRLFLLTNAMAAVLFQRQQIALHAGAIITDHGLVLLSGASGAGKSTTISALRQRGYRIFADDVVVLQPSENKIVGIASYPVVKLWEDSIEKLEMDQRSEEERIRAAVPKYLHSFHEQFVKEPMEVAQIIFLEKSSAVEQPTLRTVQGIKAFGYLKEGIYQTAQAHTLQNGEHLFHLLTTLTQRVPIRLIERNEATNSVQAVADRVIESVRWLQNQQDPSDSR